MVLNISKLDNGIKFSVKVVPKSSKNEMSVQEDGTIRLKINAPPVDGKANQACVKYLAGLFGVSKSSVTLVSGQKGRLKVFEVQGLPVELENSLKQAIQ